MKPALLHRICARPVAVAWVIGAVVLDTLLLTWPSNGVRLTSIANDWQGMAFLVLAMMAATGFGYFVGIFTCWPWLRPICGKVNGAPLKTGDCVLVLAGRHQGTTAQVYEVSTGQGGWNLARLDLGPSHRDKFTDVVEEYAVLKIEGRPGFTANRLQPTP